MSSKEERLTWPWGEQGMISQPQRLTGVWTELVEVKSLSRVRLFVIPWTVAHQAPRSMGFSGMNTGVGCHFLLQGIFLTQGSNPGLPHCRQTLYRLSYQGSPELVERLHISLRLIQGVTRRTTGEPRRPGQKQV